ncbi:mitochondrial protein ymf11 [Fagus crenata]
MGLVVPGELASNDGDSEGEEVREDVGVYGIARRERAGHVSIGALVREDPEVELGDEAGKVGEGSVGWGREGLDPES